MEPLKSNFPKQKGPERVIQDAVTVMLEKMDWLVLETHGNAFQMGFPDLYVAHYTLGTRWVEIKNPEAYSFTPAQLQTFPKLLSKGVGIWIMGYADDYEYQKLFQPPNWTEFLNKSRKTRYG